MTQQAVKEPETLEYRLPRTVVPEHYELLLAPDLANFKFDGTAKITVQIKESTSHILLNALEMEITSAEITGSGGTHKATPNLLPEQERLQLNFAEPLAAGKWVLTIKFIGNLNDKLHGFYRSTYKNLAGEQRVMAVTQMEPTDARRAFPCWDEPDFKAIFKVSLVVDEHLTALSNGGVLAEKSLGNGKKQVDFKETIKMSTYLVAFVVGEFEGTEPVMAGRTPVRVFAGPGKKHLTSFAVSAGVHSLNFFEKYYGVPYAGDKLDLIAIPDFAFGAMENLGCVTFRETALLVDEKAASHVDLERIADVVAHEIAHMWFGDLTTMSWWNGIWLNEAFATFAEMLAVDAFKPEWKRWNTFGVSRSSALVTDGLRATRPIEFPVRQPHECEAMFDVLTYEKGASVLRMLEQYLHEEVFRKGVSHYLGKHKFANTETGDLWDAIEHESKEPVRTLMDSWIFQKGYPVVTAELEPTSNNLVLSQERFFYLKDGNESQLFHVPVMLEIRHGSNKKAVKVLLTEARKVIELKDKPDAVIINAGGHGFYRVRYSSELLSMLTMNLFGNLSAIERFNLVNDAWAAVVAGYTSVEDYLKLLPLFKDETDKNVWHVIVGSLSYIERILEPADYDALRSYTRTLLGPVLKLLGWAPEKGESELIRQLRGMIIGTLGTTGDCTQTQETAAEYYEKHKADPQAVDPNIVPALVSILAATGDKARYEEFVKAWQTGKTPQEEERYLYALAGFRNKDLLKETLRKATSPEVRTQNAPYLLRSVMMNIEGRQLAWEHMKSQWEYIMTKYPNNSIARMLEGITALTTSALEQEVDSFLKQNPVKQGGKTIDQHRERLRVAIEFKQREGNKLRSALS